MTKLISTPHPREDWGHSGDRIVWVHNRLDVMKGTAHPRADNCNPSLEYDQAKTAGDTKAAVTLVQRCVSERVLDAIAEAIIAANAEPIFAFPHPSFDDADADGFKAVEHRRALNMIPFAFANYLAEAMGGTVNQSIVQAARVGRTKLGQFARFLWQPHFNGEVVAGAPYIVVDDVATTCGTLAALRGHIVRGGGEIIGATVLSHKYGSDLEFAINPTTLSRLQDLYGNDLGTYWQEIVGHDPRCLSNDEGQFLVHWGCQEGRSTWTRAERLHALRTRLAAAAAKGE
jgi:hypothetical protein